MERSNKNARWFAGLATIAVVVIIIGSLTWRNTRELLGGARLTIESPQNGKTFSAGSLITIKGSGRHISKLTLNGGKILPDQEGEFEEQIIIPSGYAVFEIKAEDRFNRESRKLVELFGN